MTSRSIPDREKLLYLGVVAGLLCSACAPREPSEEVNIADAARTARDTVGNYHQNEGRRSTSPAPHIPDAKGSAGAPTAAAPASSATGPADQPADAANTDGATGLDEGQGREAAAQVLRTYHRLIATGRYDDAWALWDRNGQASGMSRQAFAASFAKYRDYAATVGTPGRIDAGAGQRYVTVPVTVKGTLRDGSTFALSGSMVLHRAGPIDGATARQRNWRIYESELKP